MARFIAVDYEPCTGCKTCEVVCSLYHSGEINPWKSAIRVVRQEKNGLALALPLVCQECDPAPCVEACPTEAIVRAPGESVIAFDQDACSACGLCVEVCPAKCISLDPSGMVAAWCDLCGGDPQCVQVCHAKCLTEVDSSKASQQQNVDYLASVLEKEGLWKNIPSAVV